MLHLADTIPHVMRRIIEIENCFKSAGIDPAKWTQFLEGRLMAFEIDGSSDHIGIMAVHALLIIDEG